MHLVGIGRRETPVQLRSKLSRTSTQASIVNTYNTEDDLPSLAPQWQTYVPALLLRSCNSLLLLEDASAAGN